MNARAGASSWAERNQQWLSTELARLRAKLVGDGPSTPASADGFLPALERLARLFELSPFERDLLLLVAGVQIDAALAEAVHRNGGAPTFAYALAVLPGAHWDAISPDAPLRGWRLLQADPHAPVRAPLAIDEPILHHVCGVAAFDARLDGIARLGVPAAASQPDPAAPVWARRAAAACTRADARLQLTPAHATAFDAPARHDAARAVLAAAGCAGLWVQAHDLPDDPALLAGLARLLAREAALSSALVVLDAGAAGERETLAAARLAQHLPAPLLAIGAVPLPARFERIDVPEPGPHDQASRWARAAQAAGSPLPADALERALAPACRQFASRPGPLPVTALHALAAAPDEATAADAGWQALRVAARGGLDGLAQRLDGAAGLDDLVLPPALKAALADIARHLKHRQRVHGDWGFADGGMRGLGLAALFAGESGTGKTMAAEAIAAAAKLDLYRIDLASTVSKYIGETEKNLKRLFDAAEASGAVLLFDEADALFGKRSEVKDSHDRYANIEIAYLLQRIESYRGLAVLTTNMRNALDRAFLRRLRFVLHFPFPDEAARESIWRRQFGPRAPMGDVDFRALAKLPLAGGNIRSVAVNAAFKAADGAGRIEQRQLVDAARAEFAKLERSPGVVLSTDARSAA